MTEYALSGDRMDFIKENGKFLKPFQRQVFGGVLLVEAPMGVPVIEHCLYMQALIISTARGLRPFFVKKSQSPSLGLLHSYIQSAKFVVSEGISLFCRMKIVLYCITFCMNINKTKSIHSFVFDGADYGATLYDSFLAKYKKSTIDLSKLCTYVRLCIVMCEICQAHVQAMQMLKTVKADATLVYGMVGISSAVLIQCSRKQKIDVYINAGLHKNGLTRFEPHQDVVYAYTPMQKEIAMLLDMECFLEKYTKIYQSHISGSISMDAKYAFGDDENIQNDRERFCFEYGLDSQKKNIFVMLHAFTDYPHSHFKSMLFKDYGDWFLKTLEYAQTKSDVNWIFKRHPSERFYPADDIDFTRLFVNVPSNVILLDVEKQFDTRSLEYLADAVITCIGSAGFEMPALYAIPAVVAADSYYVGYDFVVKPHSLEAYYAYLDGLKDVVLLHPEAQRQAQAVYMFMYHFATVDYSFVPTPTLEGLNSPIQSESDAQAMILKLYHDKKDLIYTQLESYINAVAQHGFAALRDLNFKKIQKCSV